MEHTVLCLVFALLLQSGYASSMASCKSNEECRSVWDCDGLCENGVCIPGSLNCTDNTIPPSELPTWPGEVLTQCNKDIGKCVECNTGADCAWLRDILIKERPRDHNISVSCELNTCTASECNSDDACLKDWACDSFCQDHHNNCIYKGKNCSATNSPYCQDGWCVECTSDNECESFHACIFHMCTIAFAHTKWIIIAASTSVVLLICIIVCVVRMKRYQWKKARRQTVENLMTNMRRD